MALDFPPPSVTGQIHPGSNGINYQWDGSKWTTRITTNNSSIGSNPGTLPPIDPTIGDFWFNTLYGELMVYIDDGNNVQKWVKSSTPNANFNAEIP